MSHIHRTPGPAARQAASLWCASHCSDVNTRMSLRRRLLKPPNTYMVLKEKKKKREKEFTRNLHKQMYDILFIIFRQTSHIKSPVKNYLSRSQKSLLYLTSQIPTFHNGLCLVRTVTITYLLFWLLA